MSKTFMPELPPEQRLQLLIDHCHSREQTEYYKELTQEDLDIKRETLSENLINISEMDDELTELKKDFKLKTDPLKVENKKLLSEVKTRKEKVNGTIFHLDDQENGLMDTYDEFGEFVKSRRLLPEERQQKIFPLKKAAN